MPALESGNLSYSIWTDGKAGLGLSWFSGRLGWRESVTLQAPGSGAQSAHDIGSPSRIQREGAQAMDSNVPLSLEPGFSYLDAN